MTEQYILASIQIPQIANGVVDIELGKALSEAAAKCLEVGNQATVTVKFVIKQHNNKDGTVRIIADIDSKLPKEKNDGSIVFVTPEGNLSNSDPKQASLKLQTVAEEDASDNLKAIDAPKSALRISNGR